MGAKLSWERLNLQQVATFHQIRQRGRTEDLPDCVVHIPPKHFSRTVAGMAAGVAIIEADHRGERSFEGFDHLQRTDFMKRPTDPIAPVGATNRLHQAGASEHRKNLLKVLMREPLPLRHQL
jgi:hypothetical protein